MESDEEDEEIQASFCRFLDDNFKLPISAYAPGCLPKVEIKERLVSSFSVADIWQALPLAQSSPLSSSGKAQCGLH